MKKLIPFIFLLLPFMAISQSDSVKIVVEEMPEYPGGTDAMMKFIATNIKYPPLAVEKGIEGKVLISFVINREGKVTDAEIMRDIGFDCGKEALRVVNTMPNWKPGKQKGETVLVRMMLPVNFKLEDGQRKKKKKEKEEVVEEDVVELYDIDDEQVPPPPPPPPIAPEPPSQEEVFEIVEYSPQFPGGKDSMNAFIARNIIYPPKLLENGKQGKVYVQFVVMKDGSIKDINVLKSFDDLASKEIIRIIKSMPKWEPGKQRGKPVNVRVVVPVGFKLD